MQSAQQLSTNLDTVFAALADPTRRSIIEHLREREYTVMELAENYQMSFQAVSKHLKILEKASMITRRKEGRAFHCGYDPAPLNDAIVWLSYHHDFWNQSFDSLEGFLDNLNRSKT